MKLISEMLILPVILVTAGCGADKVQAPPPPMVKVVSASAASNIVFDSYPGVVRGRYESNLAFQTGGRILTREVQQGSFVRAGDTLMTIDARDAVQQYRASEAQVSQAQAQLELAKSNLDRYSQLFDENAIAAATLDQYRASYENAVAAYNAAVAQATQLRNNLNYTYLTANADGVISNVNAEVGQVVAAGQTVLTLVQTNELEVEIDVPENRLAEISAGKPAAVTFWAVSGTVRGAVREISPMADAAARTYRVRLSLANPPVSIQLGMTAEVAFDSPENLRGALVLPLSAIYQTGTSPQVWIVTEDNRAALKSVSVENFTGNEVLVRGISPGDRVIAAGVHKLREGQEVRTAVAQ